MSDATCYLCDRLLEGGRGYWIPNQRTGNVKIDVFVCSDCFLKWKEMERHESH